MSFSIKGWRLKPKHQKTEEIVVDSVTTRILPLKTSYAPNTPSNSWKKKANKKKKWSTKLGRYVSEDEEDYVPETVISGTWINGRFVQRSATNTYVAPRNNREFAWDADRWNNYNFNSYYNTVKDTSEVFIIKEPEGYITPSREIILNKLHIYTKEAITEVKNLCRLFYLKMLDDKEIINEEVIKNFNSSDADNKRDYYRQVYEGFVPGYTPLEQACNYYQALLDKESAGRIKPGAIGDNHEIARFDREIFANSDLRTQMQLNKTNRAFTCAILNKISLISKLGQEFKVEKEVGEKIVQNSFTYKVKNMTSYSQIDKICVYQRLLPNFNHKFLTQSLQVNIPVESKEVKQQLIIILDYSGSMGSHEKQIWVNSILADRLRYVMKGEAEVFFSYFVSNPSDLHFHHLKNAEDVISFWKTFSNTPNGGCTDMGRIVERIVSEVSDGKKFFNLKGVNLSSDKPEILIINDGQDSCNSGSFPYKVNAISLVQFSSQLKDLCVNSGGKQVRIDDKGIITTYSKDSTEILEQ